MNTVKIELTKSHTRAHVPFSADFNECARAIGGTFDRRAEDWVFGLRQEALVRGICLDVFGTDGAPQPAVTLRVDLDAANPSGRNFMLGPVQVLTKWGRDQTPSVGDGCTVVAGGLCSSGGSRNNPRITWEDGTVMEVENVPLIAAQALIALDPSAYSINTDVAESCLATSEAQLVEMLQALPADSRARVLAALTA